MLLANSACIHIKVVQPLKTKETRRNNKKNVNF